MKYTLTILFTYLVFFSGLTQKRVSLDVNYRQHSMNLSMGYHHVIFDKWLISGTAFYGKKGVYLSNYYLPRYDSKYDGVHIASPWSAVDETFESEFDKHYLKDFRVYNKAIGIQAGLGFFHNFNITHGFRTHLFAQYGYAINEVVGHYNPIENRNWSRRYKVTHPIAALSLEAYHTIRLYQKYTFYYGAKVPYYFLIDKQQFNPTYSNYNFHQWMPEIGLGITYLIGDCE